MAKQDRDPFQTPKVMRYGISVGLILTVFWVGAPLLVVAGHSGWFIVATAIYSVLLMYSVAKAQSESDKLAAMRRLLGEIKSTRPKGGADK